ncbi:MAG: glycosyltransferase family 4 protein [Methylophilaceae bacterium]|nr:glycosyltransferase family 4 protein [Methylophilaceae bacterium]
MSIRPKILYFVTEDWYFCSHRLSLALASQQAGYEVVVVTRVNQHGELIRSHGLTLIHIELSRRSRNPFKELGVIWRLFRIYRKQRPDIVHHVALKPVLYGSIAARLVGVHAVVNALAGLGFLFVSKRWQARVIRPIVESAFRLLLNRNNTRVIFQNPDDMDLLINRGVLALGQGVLIRGSGVNTTQFNVTSEVDGVPLVVLASRMLWDKGVGEFVEAARLLRLHGIAARFVLVGEGDSDNPASISFRQLSQWQGEGVVEWWGRCDDMPQILAQSHVVCLPSYREGLPKVLIEAAASGRPIVATDVPGCREIVRNGENGLLVPVRDVSALANAIKQLIENPSLRIIMGERGRAMVESEFSIEHVVCQTLALYKELIRS